MMNTLLLRYRAFWISALVVFLVTFVLAKARILLIEPSVTLENILIFGFWWLVVSFVIYRFEQVRHKWKLITNIAILISLLIGTVVIDDWTEIPNNPLTIALLVTFWLYLFYILAPVFFKKYRFLFIGFYVLVVLAFSNFRLYVDEYERYIENFVLVFMAPIPLIFALWIYEQWKWFQTLKAEKGKAELALLKSQINPHFFFNTLNNLYSLTVNHSEQAPEVILKLSEIMRYTIYEGKKEMVALAEEINYLENYIELHAIRYHQKVDLTFEHEGVAQQLIAPLLFIILLENAFKHGAETLTEGAFIKIQLVAHGNKIQFSIENNFDPQANPAPKGIGLENLRQRLDLTYPDQYELVILKKANIYKAELNLDLI